MLVQLVQCNQFILGNSQDVQELLPNDYAQAAVVHVEYLFLFIFTFCPLKSSI